MMSSAVRLIDVAKKAGVSRVAVGKVLLGSGGDRVKVNEDTARTIRELADKMGYKPNKNAQRLRGGSSNLIGVLMALNPPQSELSRLPLLEKIADTNGYNIMASTFAPEKGEEEFAEKVATLRSQGVIGIISIGGGIRAKAFKKQYTDVYFCGIQELLGASSGVIFNISSGIREAVAYLREKGKKRFAFVNSTGFLAPSYIDDYALYWEREIKYALLDVPGSSFMTVPMMVPQGERLPTMSESLKTCQVLLKNKIEAVIVKSDDVAARLIQGLLHDGVSIPDQISVVGSDNSQVSQLIYPPLTTIDIRSPEVVRSQFELLLSGKNTSSSQVCIDSKLVIRDSA